MRNHLFTIVSEINRYYGGPVRADVGDIIVINPGLWCLFVMTDATTITVLGQCGTASVALDHGSVFYFWTDACVSVDKSVIFNHVGSNYSWTGLHGNSVAGTSVGDSLKSGPIGVNSNATGSSVGIYRGR